MGKLLNEYKYDLARWGGKRRLPQIQIIKWKRICEYWKERCKPIYYLSLIIYKRLQITYGIELPVMTKVGKGFKIEHPYGIVVNYNAVLGEKCNIYNGVTIGAEKRGKRLGVPKIGNKVWIGPNSTIAGSINIGDDVLIVGGSFINFDVPDHSIVIGNPGKIISKQNATACYIE